MPRAERERLYIAEYMAEVFPEGNYQLNVELGPIPKELVRELGPTRAARVFRPSRPRVDAAAWFAGAYYLIEAKVREPKDGIGDLIMYRSLVPSTADLPQYTDQAIRLRLVIPAVLDWVRIAGQDQGIEIAEFWRDWIADYWAQRQNYFTKEFREARADKMRMRAILGLD